MKQQYLPQSHKGHSTLWCPLRLTICCSCSDDEIKTELNARGYGAVLDMDEDVALDMLFTQLVDQLIQEEKMVDLPPGTSPCMPHT